MKNRLIKAAQKSAIDLEFLEAGAMAQNSLARHYLAKGLVNVTESQIRQEHHRKLWRRWHARVFNGPPLPPTSLEDTISAHPEVSASLEMIYRS